MSEKIKKEQTVGLDLTCPARLASLNELPRGLGFNREMR